MKKNLISAILPVFFIFLLLWASLFVNAQTADADLPSDPAQWENFVNGPAHPLIRDTFRLQTFSGSPADTWNYIPSGASDLFDASEEGIENQGGSISIRLRPGSEIRFDSFDPEGHTDIRINFRYAAKELMPGENLLVSCTRPQNSVTDYPQCSVTSTHYTFSYPDADSKNYGQIGSNPSDLTLRITEGSTTANGFYCLDSLYVHGLIPRYSLFTGTSAWETPGSWSHFLPSAPRTALINGQATINHPATCHTLHIGKGHLSVPLGNRLEVNHLIFHTSPTKESGPEPGSEENYFSSEGSLQVNETVSVYRSFPETGRWYFFSLPFDVYPEGLDPGFTWKDDQANDGGNYFYLRQYNGRRRAVQQTNEGNWELLRPGSLREGEPVFHKNQGYLIALDAQATTCQLRFTSQKGDIPETFGQEGKLSFEVYASKDEKNGSHTGWNLCGNPFPSALSLNELTSDDSTDGFIYIYDGQTYQPYALGSEYVLPPFTAFFIKAQRDGTLLWQRGMGANPKHKQIPVPPALRTTWMEPQPSEAGTVSVWQVFISPPQSLLSGRSLRLENMPAETSVRLNDLQGRLLYNRQWPAGSSFVTLPPARGICFLTIETEGYRQDYKCCLE